VNFKDASFPPSGPPTSTPALQLTKNGQEQAFRITAPTVAAFRLLCPNGARQQSPRLAVPQRGRPALGKHPYGANLERVAHRPQVSLPSISFIPFKATLAEPGPKFHRTTGRAVNLLPVQPFPGWPPGGHCTQGRPAPLGRGQPWALLFYLFEVEATQSSDLWLLFYLFEVEATQSSDLWLLFYLFEVEATRSSDLRRSSFLEDPLRGNDGDAISFVLCYRCLCKLDSCLDSSLGIRARKG
jgi:hypothetical protein